MDYEKHTIATSDTCIVVKENKSKFELKNPNRIEIKKTKVDGGLISDDRERCDWLFAIQDPQPRAMFIELKGCNLDKAISQLNSTIEHTKDIFKKHSKECFAITTRVPKNDSSTRRLILDMMKKKQAKLTIKNILISVVI
ncbi:hypothetical protein [Aeromonas hydrophila]|uniref:hypothetical protein n=1 Tax=Aeromonas hydrophila TaxID=644 RepID=UPI0019324F33|nr:hypothetical protein [Aeromonas hydrophila]MBM0511449.1 hypothetical protein [Aeromonas hydrophila]MBW3771035.1 hypothetical protein [Aeromonas hydrophila]